MCSGFIGSTRFRGGQTENKEFLPLDWNADAANEPADDRRISRRATMTNWENCEANRREGEEYLRVVLEESGATRVVGEDLGTVPDYVRPSLRSLGIAGFKIPQWEFLHGRSTPGSEYRTAFGRDLRDARSQADARIWEEAVDETIADSRTGAARSVQDRGVRRDRAARRRIDLSSAIFIPQ